jgi:hypothetical protein
VPDVSLKSILRHRPEFVILAHRRTDLCRLCEALKSMRARNLMPGFLMTQTHARELECEPVEGAEVPQHLELLRWHEELAAIQIAAYRDACASTQEGQVAVCLHDWAGALTLRGLREESASWRSPFHVNYWLCVVTIKGEKQRFLRFILSKRGTTEETVSLCQEVYPRSEHDCIDLGLFLGIPISPIEEASTRRYALDSRTLSLLDLKKRE